MLAFYAKDKLGFLTSIEKSNRGGEQVRFLHAALLVLLLSISGCAWLLGLPKIESKDMSAILAQLKEDQASGCFWVGGRGGAGGGILVPPIPASGGYGSGEILFGRVNADNTKLTISNGVCSIERGGGTIVVPNPQGIAPAK